MFGRIQPPPNSAPITDKAVTPVWGKFFTLLIESLNMSDRVISDTIVTVGQSNVSIVSGLTSNFGHYRLDIINMTLSDSNPTLSLTATQDGGIIYLGGTNYNYGLQSIQYSNPIIVDSDGGNGTSSVPMMLAATSNGATNIINGHIDIYDPSDTSVPTVLTWDLSYSDSSNYLVRITGNAQMSSVGLINGIKLTPSAGNVSGGRFIFRGVN